MEKEEFARLARISRLELGEEEDSIRRDVDEILLFFDKLDSADTSGETPAFHPVEVPEKTRQDSVDEKETLENAFENGESYRFYFLGPRV